MHRMLQSPMLRIALLAMALGLLFLGQRGIWDPDEGRYTNVALHMLDSGDWIDPHRSQEISHWTKPPLTYWAIAASVGTFGHNPWAARLPAALSYLLCVWLAFRTARRLAPGSETQAALAYATMLFPIGAAHLITTDYVLAACEALAMCAFVEARFGDRARASRWIAAMWAGFALAFLAKGPPGLLPLLAVFAFDAATPGRVRPRALQWQGLLLFVLVALPWYAIVMQRNPGLMGYFLGNEVVGRVATNEFGRHGQWYGWITIYIPTLLVGTLPWTPALFRWLRQLPAAVRAWRLREGRSEDPAQLLLVCWLVLAAGVLRVALAPAAVHPAAVRAAGGARRPPALSRRPAVATLALAAGLDVRRVRLATRGRALADAQGCVGVDACDPRTRARSDQPGRLRRRHGALRAAPAPGCAGGKAVAARAAAAAIQSGVRRGHRR